MTLEMLEEMPYLKAFVKESMRVVPPVTMVCVDVSLLMKVLLKTFRSGSLQDDQGFPHLR
jgi:cytochrome P450